LVTSYSWSSKTQPDIVLYWLHHGLLPSPPCIRCHSTA